jgi:DnaJ-class molecular chaperone
MSESFYNILEVPDTATIDEIKKAYRRLSMLYHPDKNKNNSDATAKFQKISEAYETLGDIEKKNQYDMSRNNPFMRMMNNSNSGNPIDEIFANLFSQGTPFGQGGPFGQGAPFGPGINVAHFGQGIPSSQGTPFVRIFHNGVQVNPQGFVNSMQKPTPIIKHINVPIDKILTGTTIPLEIERWLIEDGNKMFENETVYITVPKGIDDGELILLREKGNIIREDCKGDIKIFVKIENNTDFKRSGLDLIYEKNITVKEALCGFSFELKYITGKTYTINNQAGNIITDGHRKIIPNMGFVRDGHTGNLVIIFNVKYPEKLTNDVVEKLKQIDF